MRVELAPDQPALVSLAVDSLGKNKLSVNPLRPPGKAERVYELRRVGDRFEYRRLGRTRPERRPPGPSSSHRAKFICARTSPEGIRLRR